VFLFTVLVATQLMGSGEEFTQLKLPQIYGKLTAI